MTVRIGWVALVLSMLLGAGSAQAAPWPAPSLFYERASSTIVMPKPVVLPSGDAVMVYWSPTAAEGGAFVSRRRAAGAAAFEAEKLIGADYGGTHHVGVDGQGRVTLVWPGQGGKVNAATLETPTGDWSAPATVYTPPVGEPGSNTQVWNLVVTPSGRAVVSLESTHTDPLTEEPVSAVRVLTREGGTWSAFTTVDSGDNYQGIDADINDAGDAVVTWARRTGRTYEFWHYTTEVATRAAGAAWTGSMTASAAGDGHNQTPAAAIDPAGRITLVWSRPGTNVTRNLATASRSAAGEWTGATEIVVPGAGKYADSPVVGTDSSGKVTLAYTDRTASPARKDITVMERPAGGSWGQPKVISTGLDNSNVLDFRVTPDGAAAMVWRNFDSGTVRIVLGHRLTDGTWSTPETVATFTSGMAYDPALGFWPGKEAVVAWGRLTSDYSNSFGEASWSVPSAPDLLAPDTAITAGPTGTAVADAATFAFTAPGETGGTFECRLDRAGQTGQWGPCASPKAYQGLGPASYTFNVRATDVADNTDASPASRSFTLQPTGGPAGAAAGTLDGTYGNGGFVFDWIADEAYALLPVAGNKVVAGTGHGLMRFGPDGTLDTGFGDQGLASVQFGTTQLNRGTRGAWDVAPAPGGKFVTTIDWWNGSDRALGLGRFNADGSVDNTFGGDGTVEASPGWALGAATVHAQEDGKVLAVVSTYGATREITVARFTETGAVDTTYGVEGKLTDRPANNHCFPKDSVLQPDGRLVVAGNCDSGAFAVRYDTDGTRDESFSGDGLAMASKMYQLESLARQPDGKLLLVGRQTPNDIDDDAAIERLNTDGTLDEGFGTGGLSMLRLSSGGDYPSDVLVQDDGRIVMLGTFARGGQYWMTRQNADGSLDPSFHQDGIAVVEADAAQVYRGNLVRQTDGKYVLGGSALRYPTSAIDDRMVLARVNDVTPPDTLAPDTVLDSGPADGASLSTGAVSFGFHSTELPATFECKLDAPGQAGEWGACASPKAYSALANGGYTFSVRARDGAGNPDASPIVRAFVVARDVVAPTVTITSGPSGTTSSTRAAFGFAASEAGATFRCALDGAAPQPCAPGAAYDVGSGPHTFSVTASDAALNESSAATRIWTVDPTSPTERHELAAGKSTPPVETGSGAQITTPVAGVVAITTASPGTAPSGYTLFGSKYDITAPAASAASPLRLVFRVNADDVPAGVDETNVVAFRDGVPIALCTTADGTATPAPCTAQRRRLSDGDLEITVLSDHASAWTLGRADAPATGTDKPGTDQTPGTPITTPPSGDPGPTVVPPALGPPVIAITFPKGVKLLPSLKNGFVVSGTTSTAAAISGTVSISAATARKLKLGRRELKLASAKGQFGAGGFSLEFKVARKLRKKLGKAKVLPLLLRGTAVGPTGERARFSKTISLRR